MRHHLTKIILIVGIIIPTFLFSACSEKKEYIHIATSSKGWLGIHAKNISEYVIYLVKGKDIRHIDLDEVEKNILS